MRDRRLQRTQQKTVRNHRGQDVENTLGKKGKSGNQEIKEKQRKNRGESTGGRESSLEIKWGRGWQEVRCRQG